MNCWYCGKDLTTERYPDLRDHVFPICLGSSSSSVNLVRSCWSCNSAKAGRTLEQFREVMERKAGSWFSQKQRDYWKQRGVELPRARHLFFGERKKVA